MSVTWNIAIVYNSAPSRYLARIVSEHIAEHSDVNWAIVENGTNPIHTFRDTFPHVVRIPLCTSYTACVDQAVEMLRKLGQPFVIQRIRQFM